MDEFIEAPILDAPVRVVRPERVGLISAMVTIWRGGGQPHSGAYTFTLGERSDEALMAGIMERLPGWMERAGFDGEERADDVDDEPDA